MRLRNQPLSFAMFQVPTQDCQSCSSLSLALSHPPPPRKRSPRLECHGGRSNVACLQKQMAHVLNCCLIASWKLLENRTVYQEMLQQSQRINSNIAGHDSCLHCWGFHQFALWIHKSKSDWRGICLCKFTLRASICRFLWTWVAFAILGEYSHFPTPTLHPFSLHFVHSHSLTVDLFYYIDIVSVCVCMWEISVFHSKQLGCAEIPSMLCIRHTAASSEFIVTLVCTVLLCIGLLHFALLERGSII